MYIHVDMYICILLYCKCSCIFMVYASVRMYSPPNRLMMCSLWNSGQCNDYAHPLRMEAENDPNWSRYLDDQLHEDRSLVAGAIQIYLCILFGIYGRHFKSTPTMLTRATGYWVISEFGDVDFRHLQAWSSNQFQSCHWSWPQNYTNYNNITQPHPKWKVII